MNCDKRKIRNDILLVAILLAVVLAAGLAFRFLRARAKASRILPQWATRWFLM